MTPPRNPLQSVHNFRDVGQFCNNSSGTSILKNGLLYRSARPDEASFLDRQRLVNDFGIKAIIDLRTKTEHIRQAHKNGDQLADPIKIPGITYHEINFNGSAFSRMLISKLSWFEFFRLVGLMVLGYRTDAIKILAPYMEDMGLVGIAQQSLDVCTAEVKEVFRVLARDESWPLLVHCYQGKDRTQVVVLLILMLLKIDPEVIKTDYELSESELASNIEERLHEISVIGLSRQFALCPSNFVPRVYSYIVEKYGSVEQYLDKAGVTKEQMDFVKGKLSIS